VQPPDRGVARPFQRWAVEGVRRDSEAVIARVMQWVGDGSGIEHEFLRHATAVDARAAQAVALDDDRLRTMPRRAFGRRQAATAAADDDKVVIARAHGAIV